jgi:hypothetical protein
MGTFEEPSTIPPLPPDAGAQREGQLLAAQHARAMLELHLGHCEEWKRYAARHEDEAIERFWTDHYAQTVVLLVEVNTKIKQLISEAPPTTPG